MPRRPAAITQADVARAIRAAKASGENRVTERLLHEEFAKEHIRGEWFQASKRLRAFIEDHKAIEI